MFKNIIRVKIHFSLDFPWLYLKNSNYIEAHRRTFFLAFERTSITFMRTFKKLLI